MTKSSGTGLLLEKAVMDVGDILTDFTHLSGSLALVIKLNDVTDKLTMSVESEAIHLLNSRNIRLISYEFNDDAKNKILERHSALTNGFHYPANAVNYQSVFTAALNKVTELVQQPAFRNRRVQVRKNDFILTKVFDW